MTPVPLDLPLRPAEAAQLGHLILDHAERKPLTDEVRNRLAARASVLKLETIRPYFGSLERDPVHPSAYYLAVDAAQGEPLLLYLALATAPTSSIFFKPLLIGRTKRPNGPEMVINSIPFGAGDRESLEKFAGRIDTAFLPRPQGSRTAIAVGPGMLPAAFDTFRAILKRTGKNVAAICVPPGGAAVRDIYSAGLWSAIRAGWREGYGAVVHIPVAAESLESAKEAIRQSAAFSAFCLDVSRLFTPGDGGTDELFEPFPPTIFPSILEVGGSVHEFPPEEQIRLSRRFGKGLGAVEQLHEFIRQTRSSLKAGKSFDLEVSLEGAGGVTTPQELMFVLHWLRSHGHAAQVVAPRLAEGEDVTASLPQLAAVARHYQCTLGIRGRADYGAEVLSQIARATAGRLHYKITGELAESAGYINFLAENLVG